MKQITFKQKVVQGIYDLFYVWKQDVNNSSAVVSSRKSWNACVFWLMSALIICYLQTESSTRHIRPVLCMEAGITQPLSRPGCANILCTRSVDISFDILVHLYQRNSP